MKVGELQIMLGHVHTSVGPRDSLFGNPSQSPAVQQYQSAGTMHTATPRDTIDRQEGIPHAAFNKDDSDTLTISIPVRHSCCTWLPDVEGGIQLCMRTNFTFKQDVFYSSQIASHQMCLSSPRSRSLVRFNYRLQSTAVSLNQMRALAKWS